MSVCVGVVATKQMAYICLLPILVKFKETG